MALHVLANGFQVRQAADRLVAVPSTAADAETAIVAEDGVVPASLASSFVTFSGLGPGQGVVRHVFAPLCYWATN